jgi:hypothetical protein
VHPGGDDGSQGRVVEGKLGHIFNDYLLGFVVESHTSRPRHLLGLRHCLIKAGIVPVTIVIGGPSTLREGLSHFVNSL